MISNGVEALPENMILQRWTKHARHMLPQDLAQYSRDNPALRVQTYRHSSLILRALRLVEMGDSNAASHTAAMKIINEGIEALAEVSKEKDGLGLAVRDQQAGSSNSGDGRIDNFPSRAPKRKNDRGRPTNKRQKAGHENLSKRPRFCSLCRSEMHTYKSCPDRGPGTKQPRRPPTCSGCGVSGHTVDRCIGYTSVNVSTQNFFM